MKKEYDLLYKKYDKAIVRSFRNYDEILEKVSEILKNKDKILDFGSGTGELVLKICKKNKKASITAIDASKNMMSLAKEKIKILGFEKRVKFICADKITGKKKYDAISSTFVLYLVDRESMLENFSSHLKKRGILVLTDLLFENTLQGLVAEWVRFFQKTHSLPVANFCRKQELKEMLGQAGFHKITFERTGSFFTLPVYLVIAIKKQ